MYPVVGFYILKPAITGKQQPKTSEKRKKNNLLKSTYKKNGAQFLHLACQGEVRTLVPPSVSPAVVALCCILLLYKNMQ